MDRTSLTPHLEMGAVVVAVAVEVAVEVVEAVRVAEERHHPDLEERGKECLFLPMWTTNCTAKALTSSQETSRRPENLLPSGTSTGVSTSTQR